MRKLIRVLCRVAVPVAMTAVGLAQEQSPPPSGAAIATQDRMYLGLFQDIAHFEAQAEVWQATGVAPTALLGLTGSESALVRTIALKCIRDLRSQVPYDGNVGGVTLAGKIAAGVASAVDELREAMGSAGFARLDRAVSAYVPASSSAYVHGSSGGDPASGRRLGLLKKPLVNTHIETIKGQLLPGGGCRLISTLEVNRNERQALAAKKAGPIRILPDGCEMDLEVGTPDPSDVQELVQRRAEERRSSKAAQATPGVAGQTYSTAYTQLAGQSDASCLPTMTCAFTTAFTTDPVDAELNRVTTDLDWYNTPTAVDPPGSSGGCNPSWAWDAWFVGRDECTMSADGTASITEGALYAFYNPVFCALLGGNATFVVYNHVDTVGKPNGVFQSVVDVSISGGCASWLDYQWAGLYCN